MGTFPTRREENITSPEKRNTSSQLNNNEQQMLVYVGRLSSKSKLFDYHGPLRRPFPKLLPRRDHLSLPPFFFPSKSSLSTNNFHRHLKSRLRKRQGNKLTGFLSRESGEERERDATGRSDLTKEATTIRDNLLDPFMPRISIHRGRSREILRPRS